MYCVTEVSDVTYRFEIHYIFGEILAYYNDCDDICQKAL